MLNDTEIQRLLDAALAGLHKGQIALSRQVIDGILQTKPEFIPALIAKALSRIVVGEYAEADTILKEQVLARAPDDPDGLVYLALSAYLDGRKDEAKELFEKVPAGSKAASAMAETFLAEMKKA